MKKYIIAVLAVICLACLGLAAACKKPYYTLTFDVPDCVTVECDAKSGAEVPQGYEINFTLVLGRDAEGEPVVKINGETVAPDETGKYTFTMESDTTVQVTGVYISGTTGVTFDNQNNLFVDFLGLDGEPLTSVDAANGDVVQFKAYISPYCDDFQIRVLANKTTVLEPVDGIYSVTVSGRVTVTFGGLPENILTASFIGREDGDGSAGHPFVIKTPLDLFVVSYMIGDGYTPGDSFLYHQAYYRLDNDIDLRGEKLFVIGDGRTVNSIFAGVFDGAGHTISNYYIDDNVIDQTTFQNTKISNVGLFGYAVASEDRPSGVYNLNLKDFTISVDGGALNTSVSAGGIAGIGIGITVSNCSVSGTMTVDSNSLYFGYAGGIMGFQQSAYNETSEMRSYSVIQSCSTEMTIMGTSGFVLAAGGISGYTYSYEERTTAAILNCYSDSDISGALRVGGIAGMINPFSSVKNCYSSGYMEAASPLTITPGLDMYSYAYAGGIVGYAEYDSMLSDSYSAAQCSAYTVVSGLNHSDGILGGMDSGDSLYFHSEPALVYNCHSTTNTVYGERVSNVTDSFLKSTLNWDEQDWHFNGDGRPTVEQESLSKTFNVTVSYMGGSEKLEITDMYYPMAYWYLAAENEDGLPQYLSDGNMRTYGYYFDAELTKKVPFGYIPTHDITIYTAFVDYSEVAGVYYLVSSGEGSYITLDLNGFLVYRNGAINCVSTYYYDGEIIVLENTFFAILLHEEFGFYTYVAEVDGRVMSIYEKPDSYSYQDENLQVVTINNYTKENPLTAVKGYEDFRYGSYYSADGISYTFNADGTGLIERPASGGNTAFTYVLNGNVLTVSHSGTTVECTVENGSVVTYGGSALSEYDVFRGEWEKASSAHMHYTFDGKGNWSYEFYGYDSEGRKVVKQSLSGTYSISGGVLSFDGTDKTATMENGELKIGGEKYYPADSFTGTWIYNTTQYTIELKLNGLNSEGYGTGSISYGANYSALEINYEIVETSAGTAIAIYYYYQGYGLLTFDSATGTLSGSIYVASADDIVSGIRFCMYDDYRGVWTGKGGAFDGVEINFNGFGNYNFAGSGNIMAVRPNVYINNKSVATYVLDEFTLDGTLTFNDGSGTYELEYNEENGTFIIKSEEGDTVLTRI